MRFLVANSEDLLLDGLHINNTEVGNTHEQGVEVERIARMHHREEGQVDD